MNPKTSEKEIALRKRYIELTDEDVALLKEVQPIIVAHLDELVEGFYSHLLQFEETRKILKDKATVNRLKEAQKRYLTSLFSGDYGPDYVESRMRIGEAHYKIGLGIHWYLGASHRYEWLLIELIRRHARLDEAKLQKLERAVCSILYLDNQWALNAYETAYTRELRNKLEELQIDHQVYESLPNCVIITDLNTNILRVNSLACKRLTGYTPEELIGKKSSIFKSERTPRYVFRELEESLLRKGAWQGEVVNKRKDGTTYDCHLTILTLKDTAGVPIGYVGIMRDITEEKRHRESIELHAQAMETMQERYRKAHEGAIYMLALACEAKDEDTGSHVLRIRGYTTAVAREMGLPDAHAEEIGISSILHDVGKLHIPDAILMKPGPLTPEEREVMNTHPLHSDRILPKEYFEIARNIARCHHENWDGTGYPSGLKGADIPIEARITKVADVFDALTSKRPYKRAWSEEEALEKVLSMKGRELCPKTVDAFESAFKKSAILEIKKKYT